MIDDLGLLLAPVAVVTGVLAFGHGTVCFVSLELGALVLSLRLFFVKNLLSSWWTGEDVALALILTRLLLRGCCPSVPRSLPPVLCSGEAGPGLTQACSPGHITAYDLEAGPLVLLPRSCSYHLPPSHGMSRLGVRVCLYILKCIISWKYWVSFLQNLSFFLRYRLNLSLPQLLASSCPGSYGREGGSAGLCLHPPAFLWLLILNGSQVSHTRSPSLLRLNLLLIPKVSILSEQMKFCFSQNIFFLILTKE